MQLTAITNTTIFTGETVVRGMNILINDGTILAIEKYVPRDAHVIDLKGKNISSGFIDIQINGGKKKYFSETPDKETLHDIYETCCEYGTPFILPTLISSPLPVILEAIEAVRNFRKTYAGVLGKHLEGPYFNPSKRGAHNAEIIRKPTDHELQRIIEHGKDVIKVMTIAPEMFTEVQLNMLINSGIILAAGHSAMTYEQAQDCFKKGIHLVTHLFNAMTQMGHRECGIVGAVFDNDDVFAPIILDGGHCHYAAARVAYKQKKDKLLLITDSSFLGRNKTRFDWEGLSIEMVEGFYRDQQGNLAGAAISMPEAIRNALEYLNVPLHEAIGMATSNVARAIKMDNEIGFVKPGYPACFTVFNDALTEVETLTIC